MGLMLCHGVVRRDKIVGLGEHKFVGLWVEMLANQRMITNLINIKECFFANQTQQILRRFVCLYFLLLVCRQRASYK